MAGICLPPRVLTLFFTFEASSDGVIRGDDGDEVVSWRDNEGPMGVRMDRGSVEWMTPCAFRSWILFLSLTLEWPRLFGGPSGIGDSRAQCAPFLLEGIRVSRVGG